MPDAQHCLAMADEADRLATIVSYGRDKVRLKAQAQSWRERADAMTAPPPSQDYVSMAGPPRSVMDWLRRRLA